MTSEKISNPVATQTLTQRCCVMTSKKLFTADTADLKLSSKEQWPKRDIECCVGSSTATGHICFRLMKQKEI